MVFSFRAGRVVSVQTKDKVHCCAAQSWRQFVNYFTIISDLHVSTHTHTWPGRAGVCVGGVVSGSGGNYSHHTPHTYHQLLGKIPPPPVVRSMDFLSARRVHRIHFPIPGALLPLKVPWKGLATFGFHRERVCFSHLFHIFFTSFVSVFPSFFSQTNSI